MAPLPFLDGFAGTGQLCPLHPPLSRPALDIRGRRPDVRPPITAQPATRPRLVLDRGRGCAPLPPTVGTPRPPRAPSPPLLAGGHPISRRETRLPRCGPVGRP